MSSISWEKPNYAFLTLWDIDHEFQKSYETYEQWLARYRRKRSTLECFGRKNQDDAVGKALRLGRQVRSLMECGQDAYGQKFEQGDSTCQTVLSAQLLRVQQEIYITLLDCVTSRTPIGIPTDYIITAAKTVRRACLNALRDLYARLLSPSAAPFLPPPRFSVKFCLFALQLQKDRTGAFQTRKVRPHDRHDEREICPHCFTHISVSAHSGLPQYRRLLFQSHIATPNANCSGDHTNQSTFACTSCYKTFHDSYDFLDHVFQKEIDSERSCLRRWSAHWELNQVFMKSDPALVEKCLRNCLKRELTRMQTMKKLDDADAQTKMDSANLSPKRLLNAPPKLHILPKLDKALPAIPSDEF
ncbi:hypothetical protein CC78DRAFT_617896 [Lojkania enalia]|uniref:C2H2-type domain-containing protein n=1 Tax=Lojkania enalia TaxID=147567 RepID=A0A9P4K8W1_9PLEO|nr:hypothetical protein CC78DRAFT_617896 [Didymosphaeria enalia]